MERLTKVDIVRRIAIRKNIATSIVKKIIDAFLGEVSAHLDKGGDVILRSFGRFKKVQTAARPVRNPRQPKKTLWLPSRQVVKFVPSQRLKSETEERKQ